MPRSPIILIWLQLKDTRYIYIFKLFGGPIDWKSSKQRTVTKSTTEAELLLLSHAASEAIYWERFFLQDGFDVNEKLALQCDNLQTTGLMTKSAPMLATKLKHVKTHGHSATREGAKRWCNACRRPYQATEPRKAS